MSNLPSKHQDLNILYGAIKQHIVLSKPFSIKAPFCSLSRLFHSIISPSLYPKPVNVACCPGVKQLHTITLQPVLGSSLEPSLQAAKEKITIEIKRNFFIVIDLWLRIILLVLRRRYYLKPPSTTYRGAPTGLSLAQECLSQSLNYNLVIVGSPVSFNPTGLQAGLITKYL